jgi:hypothetical protein
MKNNIEVIGDGIVGMRKDVLVKEKIKGINVNIIYKKLRKDNKGDGYDGIWMK